jgi:hypothetical protein
MLAPRLPTPNHIHIGNFAMDRIFNRRAWIAASCLLMGLSLLTASGCSLVATAMYVLNGNNLPADYDELKGKKVAVVCRPVTSLDFSNSSVANNLAEHVARRLNTNVRKITVIEQRKVNEWSDENNWEDYTEIGKALDADVVVGIDLEDFNLYQGQTLMQGQANVSLAVYEVKKGKQPVWSKHLPQTIFPPTGGIPASEKPEPQFRRQFVEVLSDQIARHFYPHDASTDFAPDSTVLN